MSETPRTDIIIQQTSGFGTASAIQRLVEFSRQLERAYNEVTEQRDRLMEAMTRIVNIYENREKGCIPSSSDMYDEALQFITPKNHE